jgi:hypothetical protein
MEWELPRLYRLPSPLTPGNFSSHLADRSQVWVQFNIFVGLLAKILADKRRNRNSFLGFVFLSCLVWFGLDWTGSPPHGLVIVNR